MKGPLLQLQGTAVWESVCSCINMCVVAYVYTGVCTLSSNRVIQHVSHVLTGGSVSGSSGRVRADDDDDDDDEVCGHVLPAAWFIYEVCVKPIRTMASFSSHILGSSRYIAMKICGYFRPTVTLSTLSALCFREYIFSELSAAL